MTTIDLSTKQKAIALNSLTPISIRLRRDGTWYVDSMMEIVKDGLLSSFTQSEGSADSAIDVCWSQHTAGQVIRVPGDIRLYRWNGFMWENVVNA